MGVNSELIDLENLPIGFFNRAECRHLALIANKVPENGIIVEVGSFMGRTGVILARHAKPSVKIFCIDIFTENYKSKIDTSSWVAKHTYPNCGEVYNIREEFKKNTSSYENIIPIIGHSPYDIQYPNYPIDMFFLDASHQNPNDLENLNYFCPLVKSGGFICGHDYSDQYPDVIENVKMLEKAYSNKAIILPNSSYWVIRKS
jgi:hypothetical protein